MDAAGDYVRRCEEKGVGTAVQKSTRGGWEMNALAGKVITVLQGELAVAEEIATVDAAVTSNAMMDQLRVRQHAVMTARLVSGNISMWNVSTDTVKTWGGGVSVTAGQQGRLCGTWRSQLGMAGMMRAHVWHCHMHVY